MNIAVVTGASSGIGREFARVIDTLYQLDEIWVIARRQERLQELACECQTPIRPIVLDLTVPDSYTQYQALLKQLSPQIRLLVNAAGWGLFGTFADMDLAAQLNSIDLNVKALTAVTHLSLPYMPADSQILNIASNSSWQPVPYINVYGAAKAYVMNFSRALGVELKARRIHVMAVAPGWIKTEFFDHAIHDDTIRYFDRFYTARQVADRAMKDLKKKKSVSILGFPVRMQVYLIKFLPVSLVMKIWCRQQGK